MKIQVVRSITAASLLSAGLVGWVGCNAENPDGTPTTVGKIEKKAGEELKQAEEAGAKGLQKVEEVGAKAVDATGKGLEKAGEKLQDSVKDKVPPK